MTILEKLSRRQSEVAKLVARGMSNDEVGKRLGITAGTVGVHLEWVYKKTGLKNRGELAYKLMLQEADANTSALYVRRAS
jgi:DNA-binding CsgD family transcriptional regulator